MMCLKLDISYLIPTMLKSYPEKNRKYFQFLKIFPVLRGDNIYRKFIVVSDYRKLTNEDLVELYVLNDDQIAFEVIYERLQPMIYNMVLNILGQYDLAQDIAQESLIRFAHRAKTYDREKSLVSTYLVTIARGEACRYKKKSQKETNFSLLDTVNQLIFKGDKKVNDEMFIKGIHKQVKEIIGELPLVDQTIFNLRFYGELSSNEILVNLRQQGFDIKDEKTINNRIFKIKSLLIKLLGNDYYKYIE